MECYTCSSCLELSSFWMFASFKYLIFILLLLFLPHLFVSSSIYPLCTFQTLDAVNWSLSHRESSQLQLWKQMTWRIRNSLENLIHMQLCIFVHYSRLKQILSKTTLIQFGTKHLSWLLKTRRLNVLLLRFDSLTSFYLLECCFYSRYYAWGFTCSF